ncbi:hypothetical protein [Ottowia testudinis]|uniref:Arc family DNA-binding protein n=1 Tax=Ottowia testudinis TaxID=2816950 RepID=A0A975CFG2_9BURK|nr:hypothetical protein [Ottowia testudinis]QTD44574.1 hypothetical protein J1M35_15960 [Ottowia testudinis]
MEDEDRYTRITLRIPRDLHQVLVSAADSTSKSLNAEIIGRLQASVFEDEELAGAAKAKSTIADDLLRAVVERSVLEAERGVFQLRMDLAKITGHQITGLAEMAQRLSQVDAEIARCELAIQRFKTDATRSAAASTTKRTGSRK